MSSLNEVESTYSRLIARKNVRGVVLATRPEGLIIRSSLSDELSKIYGKVISELLNVAQNAVKSIDDQDLLKFLRVRTAKHEIMISPGNFYAFRV
ncbi:hypothetical protein DSO57_1006936 [Entomophthora muscae]|uniref:Uncharacterized protein n=1 Tax=Entomophthora muscae TaxID=34485 RepID=A0ACC2SWE6_9FUNG|nr:hypothetical protein DSO57_1006936 [Entomophthora muscae]